MEKAKTRVLFVEDDLNLGFLTMEFLESEGYDVKLCKDGEAGYKAFKEHDFDICVLDVMLPKMDGFQLAELIRKENKSIPILFLTAKNMKADKHIGFKIGADDYLTKPFDEEELSWRINAILNRTTNIKPIETIEIKLGVFTFNPQNQLLISNNSEQRLTERETKVLQVLCANKGNITRREELLEKIWGENDYFAGRSLDVFIAKLRKYLKADVNVTIENIPRVGFLLKD